MQSKNKNVRFQLPDRYKKYCEVKRCFRERSRSEILPIGEGNGEADEMRDRITNASKREFKWREVSPALCARDYKEPKIVQINKPIHSNNRVYSSDGLSPTLNAMGGGNRQPFIRKIIDNKGKVTEKKDGSSYTLTASGRNCGNNQGVFNYGDVRRLTPTECMRLQGFPDKWCDVGIDGKEISNTQKYKMAGNAVTTNVITEIMKRLMLTSE